MSEPQPGRTRAIRAALVSALILLTLATGCGGAERIPVRPLKLAAARSLETSGLLDLTVPYFESEFGVPVEVHAVSLEEAFALGESGEVDVLWVNDPEAEESFVAAGYGLKRVPVMNSAFALVGPLEDPVEVRRAETIFEAFTKIAEVQAPFLLIDNGSGARTKEAAVWAEADVDPQGGWYEIAQDDLKTALGKADSRQAYVFCDRAGFLAHRGAAPSLDILFEDFDLLRNPYTAIAVNPAAHPQVNSGAAEHFLIWLTLETTRFRIGTTLIGGKQAYFPEGEEWGPTTPTQRASP